jgi:putative salt-induced outer membrane protein YdiY
MTIFSLKVSNTIRYVNQPVPGFQTTDTITAVALVAKF